MTSKLHTLGFVYLGTNENGTETFLIDGMEVRSYKSGYVRRIKRWRNRRGESVSTCWQINKVIKMPYEVETSHTTFRGLTNVRVLLDTHTERYERLCSWITNKRRKDEKR